MTIEDFAGLDVIEVSERRSKDAIAVVFSNLAYVFNLIVTPEGLRFALGADINCAALRTVLGVADITEEQRSRLAEYVRFRIADALQKDLINILEPYPTPSERRRKELEQIADEITG